MDRRAWSPGFSGVTGLPLRVAPTEERIVGEVFRSAQLCIEFNRNRDGTERAKPHVMFPDNGRVTIPYAPDNQGRLAYLRIDRENGDEISLFMDKGQLALIDETTQMRIVFDGAEVVILRGHGENIEYYRLPELAKSSNERAMVSESQETDPSRELAKDTDLRTVVLGGEAIDHVPLTEDESAALDAWLERSGRGAQALAAGRDRAFEECAEAVEMHVGGELGEQLAASFRARKGASS